MKSLLGGYSITVSCIQAVSGRGAVLDAPVWGGGETAVKPSTSVLSQGEVGNLSMGTIRSSAQIDSSVGMLKEASTPQFQSRLLYT